MTLEELNRQIDVLGKKYNFDRLAIQKAYCDANNPYKVGDVFTDHIGSIRIEHIRQSPYSANGVPCCVYIGKILKKDGIPTKKMETRDAWQSNELKK